jgi:hypothetical protein
MNRAAVHGKRSDPSAAGDRIEAVRGFERLRRTNVAFAGGKGGNLGELTAAGLPAAFVRGSPSGWPASTRRTPVSSIAPRPRSA